jgi:hypothetical protein
VARNPRDPLGDTFFFFKIVLEFSFVFVINRKVKRQ